MAKLLQSVSYNEKVKVVPMLPQGWTRSLWRISRAGVHIPSQKGKHLSRFGHLKPLVGGAWSPDVCETGIPKFEVTLDHSVVLGLKWKRRENKREINSLN